MAFGTPVAAGFDNSASGGTTMFPAYPAGILSTDQLVMFVGMKPATANGGTLTTPSGWTLRDSLLAAGGYGTTLGADVGNTNLWVLTKNTVTQGQSGTVSLTIGDNNISWSVIIRVPTNGGAISYGSSSGSDTSAGDLNVTLSANPGLSAVDMCVWAMCIPTDVQTPSQFSSHAISASGATFATPTELAEPDTNVGNDLAGFYAYTTVSTGPASTAPAIVASAASVNTNVRGPVVFLRLRETVTGTLGATESGGKDSFSATGSTLGTVTGTCAATESAGDYFFSSNVGEPPTDLFTGSVNGGWYDTEPISRFEVWNTTNPLTAYGQTWGQWLDRSGNNNKLSNSNEFALDTAYNDAGLKSTNIYQALPSTAGGGSTTGFYFCASLTGDYYGTIFSDVNTANTGFKISHNANLSSDIIFSVGTGAARVSLSTPSGQTQFTLLTTRVIIEAWSDGLSLFLRINRGVTKTASIGSAISAGTTGFKIGNNVDNNDAWSGRIYQIIYSKNAYPVGYLRNSIAQFAGIKGQIVLAVPSPFGAFDSSEGADTFAGTGTVPVSAITGSMAVTEAGADSFTSSGKVIVQGALAATEVGADAFAASGKVIVQGALAASETGPDTFTSSGKVIVQGTLAASETEADSFASTGKVIVQGSFTSSEVGTDTFAGSGGAFTTGSMAAIETGADAFASTGNVIVLGALAALEVGADAFASTAKLIVQGSLAVSETGTDTFASSGGQVATGVMAVTETGADTFASTGKVFVSGTLAAAEVGADTFISTGGALTTGTMAAAETGADLFAATGTVLVAGTFHGTEVGSDAVAASGTVLVQGTLVATEVGADVFAGTGETLGTIEGTFAAIELSDTAQITGRVLVEALFAAAESGSDLANFSGIVLPFPTNLLAGTLCPRMKPTTAMRPQPTMIRHDNTQNFRCDDSVHNAE